MVPSDPIRVIMLASDYLDSRHGGVETHIFYLSRALTALGHQVRIVRVSPELPRFTPPAEVPYCHVSAGRASGAVGHLAARIPHSLGREFSQRVAQNLDVRSILSRLPPLHDERTVVHQHDFIANLALTKTLARRLPVVWTNHLGEYLVMRRSRIGRAMLPALTSHYAYAMAPSQELADIPSMGGRVVSNVAGVDSAHFCPVAESERGRLRHGFGWSEQDFVVLVPRRWAPTKGVVFAARALANLRDLPSVRAVFVGAGLSEYPAYAAEVRSALRQCAARTDVVDHVEQSQMRDYYRAADLTVIPSLAEAISLAALEAMACGCLVLASSVGGMRELIDNGRNGLLVPAGDARRLSASIRAVLTLSGPERQAMRREARLGALRRSWAGIANEAAVLYERAIAERATDRSPLWMSSP